MPIVLDPLSILLLKTFQPPCTSQLGSNRAGTSKYSLLFTFPNWEHALEFVGKQPSRPLRVGQIARLEFILDGRRVPDAVITLLAPLDFFQTLNAGDILHPLGF